MSTTSNERVGWPPYGGSDEWRQGDLEVRRCLPDMARIVAAWTLLVAVGPMLSIADGEAGGNGKSEIERPEVRDDRFALSLFASEPDIVTPIGVAVDEQDRIYVLESHTHLESDDYPGPDSDRVKIFIDRDRDGVADNHHVFAKGIENGMNIAFSPEGTLFVVTSRAVWALYDRDRDGQCEDRKRIARLTEPDHVYDHASLMGIAFSQDGWVYISRGNLGGAPWRMEGADGSVVSGFGDGGNIMRCQPDGSRLEEVAIGFWNPFGLAFDADGRLLASDNDPDSRGPNRLVHVIPGGDYGYKALYGGSGIHPYLSWNGELPGTLPYAAPLGEAPSGILPTNHTAFPADHNAVLAAIWEENSIVGVDLGRRGVSLVGEPETLIQGGNLFHPVAMAADSTGTIYITDWVVRQYPNHGKGRIWRLAPQTGVGAKAPQHRSASTRSDGGTSHLRTIEAANEAGDFPTLKRSLASEDPFVRSAAITASTRPVFREAVVQATQHEDPDIRVGALLALHRSDFQGENAEAVAGRLLQDPEPTVRRMALIWVGRETMTSLRPVLERSLTRGRITAELFETYLATVRHLRPSFVEAYRNRDRSASDALQLPEGFIRSLIENDSKPAIIRAVALQYLDDGETHLDLLRHLVKSDVEAVRVEAIRTLASVADSGAAEALADVALSESASPTLRAEAFLSLSWQSGNHADDVLGLLGHSSRVVELAAARYLRSRSLNDEARRAVRERLQILRADRERIAVAEQLELIVDPVSGAERPDRPDGRDAWRHAVAQGGDPSIGRRVFFSPLARCSQCHTIGNRGGYFGPDLTGVGRSKSRKQLLDSILQPSEQIAPGWQTWFVKTADGQTHFGRQIDVHFDDVEIFVQREHGGEFKTFEDVDDYGVVETSLMPDGLEQQLTVSDMRSLIAFLKEEP